MEEAELQPLPPLGSPSIFDSQAPTEAGMASPFLSLSGTTPSLSNEGLFIDQPGSDGPSLNGPQASYTGKIRRQPPFSSSLRSRTVYPGESPYSGPSSRAAQEPSEKPSPENTANKNSEQQDSTLHELISEAATSAWARQGCEERRSKAGCSPEKAALVRADSDPLTILQNFLLYQHISPVPPDDEVYEESSANQEGSPSQEDFTEDAPSVRNHGADSSQETTSSFRYLSAVCQPNYLEYCSADPSFFGDSGEELFAERPSPAQQGSHPDEENPPEEDVAIHPEEPPTLQEHLYNADHSVLHGEPAEQDASNQPEEFPALQEQPSPSQQEFHPPTREDPPEEDAAICSEEPPALQEHPPEDDSSIYPEEPLASQEHPPSSECPVLQEEPPEEDASIHLEEPPILQENIPDADHLVASEEPPAGDVSICQEEPLKLQERPSPPQQELPPPTREEPPEEAAAFCPENPPGLQEHPPGAEYMAPQEEPPDDELDFPGPRVPPNTPSSSYYSDQSLASSSPELPECSRTEPSFKDELIAFEFHAERDLWLNNKLLILFHAWWLLQSRAEVAITPYDPKSVPGQVCTKMICYRIGFSWETSFEVLQDTLSRNISIIYCLLTTQSVQAPLTLDDGSISYDVKASPGAGRRNIDAIQAIRTLGWTSAKLQHAVGLLNIIIWDDETLGRAAVQRYEHEPTKDKKKKKKVESREETHCKLMEHMAKIVVRHKEKRESGSLLYVDQEGDMT